jgi:hypothetical protein
LYFVSKKHEKFRKKLKFSTRLLVTVVGALARQVTERVTTVSLCVIAAATATLFGLISTLSLQRLLADVAVVLEVYFSLYLFLIGFYSFNILLI